MPARETIPESARELSQWVIEFSLAQGFALAGVARAEPSPHAEHVRRWLSEGRHGEMAYLADDAATRLDPSRLVPGARSVIMVALAYDDSPPSASDHDLAQGSVARYARGPDYHTVLKRRLHRLADRLRERFGGAYLDRPPDPAAQPPAGHLFRTFVDTAPVLEREHAQRAGLGWIGKHTLLIHPRAGSYLLLGGILTTLNMEPWPGESVSDHCGSCTRCIDACPTSAIAPYSVDASRCISYLTIEHRGPVEPSLAARSGQWVFGCDVCQEVCPFNAPTRLARTPRSALAPPAPSPMQEVSARPRRGRDDGGGDTRATQEPRAPRIVSLPLLGVLNWKEADRRSALSGTAMKRASLDMLRRNAAIAARNLLATRDDPELRAALQQVQADPSETPLVRDAAALRP